MQIDFLKNYTIGAMDALLKNRDLMRQSTTSRPQTQQNTSTTSTIKNFFGGKNKNNANKDTAGQIDASKYLDLNKFWQISLDINAGTTQKTRQKALAALIDILKKYQREKCFLNQMSKVDFMNLALENISNNTCMYTSINFLQSLIMTYPRDSGNGRNYSQQYQGRG